MNIAEDKKTNGLVDLSYLNQVCDGDQDFISSIVSTFMEDAPIILSRLLEHITQGNWPQASQAAHQLKPSLQFVGLQVTLEKLKTIEQRSKQRIDLDSLADLARSVQQDVKAAIIELRELVDN